MIRYSSQKRILVAVDCIVFGFDGEHLKLLLIHRGFEPEKEKWSLMGGFIEPEEDLDQAANRVLKELTGLDGVYLEQFHAMGDPNRDPIERTVCVAYFALIDIHKYQKQISDQYHAEWFLLKEMPTLIFDHNEIVELAKKKLRYKAALHPILFELLPPKFTLPQLQLLYEAIYDTEFDKRNFSRKVLSTGLLLKQTDKDKRSSKKGAFYYSLHEGEYFDKFDAFLNFIPNPHLLIA